MTGRIKVLHAVPDLEYGGLQRLVVDLIERTDPERFQVEVLVFGEVGPLADQLTAKARLHRAVPQEPWSMLIPARLTGQIRQLAPDVVHSHSGVWYKTSLAARRAGVRLILHTDHGRNSPDPVLERLVDHLASRRTDVVAAVSERLARQVKATVAAHPERVRLVINGVDTELHRPGGQPSVRAELGIDRETVVIGSIGRLEPIKGYDLLVEAWARLAARLPDPASAVAVIAGDGSERARLETRVRELGLERSVRFLGWRADVGALHSTFDLFTITSRSEGTSVSLLEAMSAGLCPMVTAVGGNAEVLGPALAHRLVRPGDPDAIAAGWLDAIRDRERRADDGAAARRRVKTAYSLDAMVRAYEEIYAAGIGPTREPEREPSHADRR